jgi:hypothetical protein
MPMPQAVSAVAGPGLALPARAGSAPGGTPVFRVATRGFPAAFAVAAAGRSAE